MNRPFYKSLDREFEIFGIKGRWVKLFLIAAGSSVVLGIIVGAMSTSGIGVVTVIVCVALAFFGCLTMQARLPGRQVQKAALSGRMPGWVIRRETLGRIILKDARYGKVKEYLATHRDDAVKK